MTKKEIDLISSQGKGVNRKYYYDEFGTTYIGTNTGRIVRYIGNTVQQVTAQVTSSALSASPISDLSALVTDIVTNLLSTLSLDDLSDVMINSPSTNQYLFYDGTEWTNGNLVAGRDTVIDLGDRTVGLDFSDYGYRL